MRAAMRGALWAVLGTAACGASCRDRHGGGEGVIVRQVLHGSDLVKEAIVPVSTAPTPAAIGQVAATLVSDSPQAAYKQALEYARKQLETETVRAALSRMDSEIEQQQETVP